MPRQSDRSQYIIEQIPGNFLIVLEKNRGNQQFFSNCFRSVSSRQEKRSSPGKDLHRSVKQFFLSLRQIYE